MGLRDVLRTLIRRWYVVGPLLALTVFAAAAAATTGPPRYFSGAVLLLTQSPTGNTAYHNANPRDHSNPFFLSDGNVAVTSAMLVQRMNSQEFLARIGATDAGSVQLTIDNGATNPELLVSGPFVFINASSDSPETPKELVTRAVAEARTELDQWQVAADAPASTFMTLTDIMPPSDPVAAHGSAGRAAVAVLVLGLLACFKVGLTVDRIASLRAASTTRAPVRQIPERPVREAPEEWRATHPETIGDRNRDRDRPAELQSGGRG